MSVDHHSGKDEGSAIFFVIFIIMFTEPCSVTTSHCVCIIEHWNILETRNITNKKDVTRGNNGLLYDDPLVAFQFSIWLMSCTFHKYCSYHIGSIGKVVEPSVLQIITSKHEWLLKLQLYLKLDASFASQSGWRCRRPPPLGATSPRVRWIDMSQLSQ